MKGRISGVKVQEKVDVNCVSSAFWVQVGSLQFGCALHLTFAIAMQSLCHHVSSPILRRFEKWGPSCATIVCWEGVGEVVLACGSGVCLVQERQSFVRGLFAV